MQQPHSHSHPHSQPQIPSPLDPSEFLLSEPPGLLARGTPARLRPGGLELHEMVQSFLHSSATGPSKEVLRGLLHQFDKTQLIEVILTAEGDSHALSETVRGLVASSSTFRRLLVRNIPFSATSETVKSLLAPFGQVEEGAVVFDRLTGRSKGFAFATFADVSAACAAVAASLREELVMDSRTVFLKFAADRNEADRTAAAQPDFFAASPASQTTAVKLFVYNLSPTTSSESLKSAFGPFGEISECAVVCDAQGRSKRFAFVTFVHEEDAWKCLQEPNRTIDGRMTFTHLASEGRTPTAGRVGSGQTGGSGFIRSPSIRTPRETQHVFTPQGAAVAGGSLLNESLLSQWIAELSTVEAADVRSPLV